MLDVERPRLACRLRAPPRIWALLAVLAALRPWRAQLGRWRSRRHARRRTATPRVPPSGAASHLGPSRRPGGAPAVEGPAGSLALSAARSTSNGHALRTAF